MVVPPQFDGFLCPPPASEQPHPDPVGERPPGSSFNALYAQHFEFVWRVARRLGVRDGAIDDVVQDIFVIVHRWLPSFGGHSSLKTWLFGITRRVVKDHLRRRPEQVVHEPLADELVGARRTALSMWRPGARPRGCFTACWMSWMRPNGRCSLEQMTASEIAEALGLNLNTVYFAAAPVAEPQPPAAEPDVTPPPRPPRHALLAASARRVETDSLAEELRLLREAQVARRSGSPTLALERVREPAGRFPEGLLRAEREAAEVLVLCELGQVSEASQRAALFEQRDPDSPLRRALHVSCAAKQK